MNLDEAMCVEEWGIVEQILAEASGVPDSVCELQAKVSRNGQSVVGSVMDFGLRQGV